VPCLQLLADPRAEPLSCALQDTAPLPARAALFLLITVVYRVLFCGTQVSSGHQIADVHNMPLLMPGVGCKVYLVRFQVYKEKQIILFLSCY